jgi:hypothetical protein
LNSDGGDGNRKGMEDKQQEDYGMEMSFSYFSSNFPGFSMDFPIQRAKCF